MGDEPRGAGEQLMFSFSSGCLHSEGKKELSLEFGLPEGEIEEGKKMRVVQLRGAFFKSERFVEAKRSFSRHH